MHPYAIRVIEALARGEKCGTAVICRKHGRPMSNRPTWFGIAVCCPFPSADQPAPAVVHGIVEAQRELSVTSHESSGKERTD